MKRQLADHATWLLCVCAIVTTTMAVSNKVAERRPRIIERAGTPVRDDGVSQGGHILGSDSARVEIVEFADYQCPSCRQLEATLSAMRAKAPGAFRVRFRHFPLTSLHSEALNAASASECAAVQNKFEAVHTALFNLPETKGGWPFAAIAHQAGVADTAAFMRCMADSETAAAIARDVSIGKQIGVNGTPAMVIGGRLYHGTMSESRIDSLVKKGAH
jgi:protein-disulfide isomerase